jgi:hypothetical protein
MKNKKRMRVKKTGIEKLWNRLKRVANRGECQVGTVQLNSRIIKRRDRR